MSSTQEGTTLILASIAVCLMIYAMNQQYRKSSPAALGSSMDLGSRFGNLRQRIIDWNNQRKARAAKAKRKAKAALGARKARVDPNLDCSDVSPSDPNWARCAQGAGVGRIPTRNAKNAVFNFQLDAEKDGIKHQGLGTRIQDSFVQDQFDSDSKTNLGSSGLGGMRIDPSNLKNNAFFSQGTENASSAVTSGLSAQGAAAFPFARRSDRESDESETGPAQTGPVSGTEAVGMGMSFKEFTKGSNREGFKGRNAPRGKREVIDQQGKGKGRGEFVATPEDDVVGSAFNPFVDTPSKAVGSGLLISEAFQSKSLGSGSLLTDAFDGSLGAAVSPVTSEVGVSPEEIAAATAILDNVNIVQSTIGGQLNFGIRP